MNPCIRSKIEEVKQQFYDPSNKYKVSEDLLDFLKLDEREEEGLLILEFLKEYHLKEQERLEEYRKNGLYAPNPSELSLKQFYKALVYGVLYKLDFSDMEIRINFPDISFEKCIFNRTQLGGQVDWSLYFKECQICTSDIKDLKTKSLAFIKTLIAYSAVDKLDVYKLVIRSCLNLRSIETRWSNININKIEKSIFYNPLKETKDRLEKSPEQKVEEIINKINNSKKPATFKI